MKIIENNTKTTTSEEELELLDVAREVAKGRDSAFLVCDLSAISRNCKEILESGAAVRPRFDIFCNCAPVVLRHLSDLGFEFRARNKNEIKMAASAGVPACRVTLDGSAGLVASHLRLAAAEGVGRVVARTPADLAKIKREFPDAGVLLSLGAPKSGGGGNSGIFDQGSELLRQSAKLGLRVAGLSFEDAENDDDESDAIDARKRLALTKLLLTVGRSQFGHSHMDTVHLGGNISGDVFATLDEEVEVSVDFSEAAVASAFVLCTKVIGKRIASSVAGGACNRTIVIDDGVFGHFGQRLHADRPLPNPRLLDSRSGEDGLPPLYCDILGPSGDDADIVGLGVPVANGGREIEVGDWLAFPRMGAETLTPAGPRSDGIPVTTESGYWVFTSESDLENDVDNLMNRADGGLRTIEAEDCLAAAERFAISCTDTDLAQMAEMLTGLK